MSHNGVGDIYSIGPCAGLAAMGESGWNTLDLDYILRLQEFVADNCEISLVQDIVYGSVISGEISVRTSAEIDREQKSVSKHEQSAQSKQDAPVKPGMERVNKSEPLVHLSARDEVGQRMRSMMWAKFIIGSFKQEDVAGFFAVTSAPNTPDHALIRATDPKRPCLLQFDKLTRIMHRVDVLGTHEFQFFTRGLDPMTEVEIPNVLVMGSEMPSATGRLNSKIIRLYKGPWKVYSDKLLHTHRADRERANPTLVTVEDGAVNAHNSDPQLISTYTGINDLGGRGLTPMQAAQASAVADAVSMRNCMSSSAAAAAAAGSTTPAANPRKRKERGSGDGEGFSEYEVAPGRLIASNHMPEAPADPLPWKLAVLESTCLTYKLPMAMLTTGDASGRSRLSAATSSVSGRSSRVYVEAQAAMRRQIEGRIGAVYNHMYTHDNLRGLIDRRLKSSAGKEGPSLDELNDAALVLVNVSGTVDPEHIQALYAEGSLRYPAYVSNMARYMGLSQSDFATKPLIDVADLMGVSLPDPPEPKEPAAGGGAGGGAKKKNRKKNKKAKASA